MNDGKSLLGRLREATESSRVRRPLAAVALAAVLAFAATVPSARAAEATRVDVNNASVEQLTALPGIGAAKAAAIVEERSKAPFVSVADLERVHGIGPALVAELEKHVVVSSKSAQ
jgi:competence protein ComEA